MATAGLLEHLKGRLILDLACTQHLSPRRSDFVTFTNINIDIAGIGDTPVKATGKGNIQIVCNVNGKRVEMILHEVLYVPYIGPTLISVSQILKRQRDISISFKTCDTGIRTALITSKERTINFTASESEGLFFLDLWDNPKVTALTAYSLSDPFANFWHLRYCHLGDANIQRARKVVHGMTMPEGCLCIDCVETRLKQRPHKGHFKRGKYPMEFLHVDIKYISQEGYDGSRYAGIILCDNTQRVWAKGLVNKADLCDFILDTVAAHETPERRCRRMRVDQAGENRSTRLIQTCRNRGTIIEPTGTDQHQQNGSAEVTVRIIQERLAPTMRSSGLDMKWWPEILRTIATTKNLSPSSVLDGITPYEAWHGYKPDVSNLRAPGTKGYLITKKDSMTNKGKRKIVDTKTEPCRMIGYAEDTLAIWKVLKDNGQIVLTSDAFFDEDRPHIPCTDCTNIEAQPTTETVMDQAMTPSNRNTEGQRTTDTVMNTAAMPSNTTAMDPTGTAVNTPLVMDSETTTRKKRKISETGELVDSWPPKMPLSIDKTDKNLPAQPDLIITPEPPKHISEHPVRISSRPNKGQPPKSYGVVTALLAAPSPEPTEPKSYKEAMKDPNWKMWKAGVGCELNSLEENKTWILTPLPDGANLLRGKWVFRLKRGPDGSILRYKARWVVRGFEQIEGIDYFETFASVVKPMSYKALFAIAAALDLEIEQMDVSTAFLYGDIDGTVYVEQPHGCEDGTERVCLLKKALYGLKQSPRIWYQTLAAFLKEIGFTPLNSDLAVFCKGSIFIAVYVDDLLIIGPDKGEIQKIKDALSTRFKMTDLGPCKFYLGMEVYRDRPNRILQLTQAGYIERVLYGFGMNECKPLVVPMDPNIRLETTPKDYTASKEDRDWYARLVGSLMYIMLGTRADIAYTVAVLCRYLSNPSEQHLLAAKRILRYLRGSTNLALTFRGDLKPLLGYTDADWGGDLDTRRSTAGYLFNVGSGAISWSSKRQPTVALSSCEAEYMGETQATKEAVWLRSLLTELHANRSQTQATIIFGDNQGAIALAKNPQFHARTKHIDIQHHFVREKQDEGLVDICYISSAEQVADGLTKALPRDAFQRFRTALGLERLITRAN
jgi:hypothetical protein